MGEYDCYCAFCSGCLYVPGAYGSDVFGSEAREALERRRERLREKIQAQDHTYDPTIVDHDCLKWLGSARALGMNMEARAASKAFISGRGTYSSYGDFNPEHGSDPNDDGTNPLPCFVSYDEDVPPAYPFHEACYRLFCHALFGHEDMNQIDKDVMYSTMRSLSGDRDTSCLSLDYGGMEGPEHTWYCISGEEYTVFKPSTNPKLIDVLRDLLPNQGFSGPSIDRLSIDSELETKVRNDIFSMLPLDILYMLFPYLSSETSINLMNASWHVFKATRRNGFWKQMIRNHILPWFWEFDTFIQTEDLDHIECRGLYVWLEGITRPQFGIRGPWMGLANRRRILNACEQVKKVYLKLKEGNYGVQGSHCGNGTDDDEAEEIKDDSVSLHLPAILEPKPAAELTTSVQWIRAWDEVESPGKIFESFWNGDGVLAGLGVVINSHRRVLGPTDEVPGIRKFSIDVPDAEWIEEILLHLTDPDILSEDESARTSAVKGLTVRSDPSPFRPHSLTP
ncbi:hypothetical protein BCR34DRAFT_333826 [Clohesyomyces aquaticus]|uniref:F-box domain-containing protein n=1 Tax=Clohesyomyces aquaticus TaxID=1231657 RepID=A0A1Y1ZLR0_9PLEO|nr:hypothetical protein BCR34DRAFT_333826 [Clohesyomyces aquaticus]